MRTLLPPKPERFNISKEFSKLATIVVTCDLRPNEKDTFETACRYVMTQLRSDGVTPPEVFVNIIFAAEDDVVLRFEPSHYGACFTGIYYPVHKWRARDLNDLQIMTCMVEEMCHIFWCIQDEDKVKYKVLDVIRVGHPKLNLEDLYPYRRVRWNLRL